MACAAKQLELFPAPARARDITTGAELLGGPVTVQATYPGTGANSSGGIVTFDAQQYKDRAALLLLNGVVYTSWASAPQHFNPYTACGSSATTR